MTKDQEVNCSTIKAKEKGLYTMQSPLRIVSSAPNLECPSCLQTTLASTSLNSSLQMVPQAFPMQTNTLPSLPSTTEPDSVSLHAASLEKATLQCSDCSKSRRQLPYNTYVRPPSAAAGQTYFAKATRREAKYSVQDNFMVLILRIRLLEQGHAGAAHPPP